MAKSSTTGLTKKDYFKLREVEKLYKMIHKYNLRQEAYKNLLKAYTKLKKANQKL